MCNSVRLLFSQTLWLKNVWKHAQIRPLLIIKPTRVRWINARWDSLLIWAAGRASSLAMQICSATIKRSAANKKFNVRQGCFMMPGKIYVFLAALLGCSKTWIASSVWINARQDLKELRLLRDANLYVKTVLRVCTIFCLFSVKPLALLDTILETIQLHLLLLFGSNFI